MPVQTTPKEIIEREKQLVTKLAGANEVSFNDIGWDSRVYSVNNGQYYFKFPRSEKIQKRFAAQIAALKLAEEIDTKIKFPKVLWRHPANDYFGYVGVAGKPLDAIISTLDNDTKQTIGEILGSFLRQFHQLKLKGARDMSIEEEMKQLQFWYDKGLPITQKVFTESEQKQLRDLVYEQCPKLLSELGSDMSLCHGDFGSWNIIYDDNEDQIGIIDFGDICRCDSSKDFIGFDDPIVFESAFKAYGGNDNLKQKIDTRRIIPEVISLRFYNDKQDKAGIKKTVPKIKAILAQL